MKRLLACVLAGLISCLWSRVGAAQCPRENTRNPDEIAVYFPAFSGGDSLGFNVSTLLSLQLMQTFRATPWPVNRNEEDFGSGMIRWSRDALYEPTHRQAALEATDTTLLSQLVVWGSTRLYGGDIVVDVNVTVPVFARPKTCDEEQVPCDYREKHLERWTIDRGAGSLSVDLPRRAFSVSSIVLDADIVESFQREDGLPIYSSKEERDLIGRTGARTRYSQFDTSSEGAFARVASNDLEGWVHLPTVHSDGRNGELTHMVAGIIRTMRGDWSGAEHSFKSVVENHATRWPLRLDALLLLGMVQTRGGRDGGNAFQAALEQAPFDHRATRYAVMGMLACGGEESGTQALNLLERKRHLFGSDDVWFRSAGKTALAIQSK